MSEQRKLRLEDVSVGDYIEVRIGDAGHLSGGLLFGNIVEINPNHGLVKLETGWCCSVRDTLLKKVLASAVHRSDCARHNEPAYRNGTCDCPAGVVELPHGT